MGSEDKRIGAELPIPLGTRVRIQDRCKHRAGDVGFLMQYSKCFAADNEVRVSNVADDDLLRLRGWSMWIDIDMLDTMDADPVPALDCSPKRVFSLQEAISELEEERDDLKLDLSSEKAGRECDLAQLREALGLLPDAATMDTIVELVKENRRELDHERSAMARFRRGIAAAMLCTDDEPRMSNDQLVKRAEGVWIDRETYSEERETERAARLRSEAALAELRSEIPEREKASQSLGAELACQETREERRILRAELSAAEVFVAELGRVHERLTTLSDEQFGYTSTAPCEALISRIDAGITELKHDLSARSVDAEQERDDIYAALYDGPDIDEPDEHNDPGTYATWHFPNGSKLMITVLDGDTSWTFHAKKGGSIRGAPIAGTSDDAETAKAIRGR